jgi:tetratricopeptide (TPR) repeat protein
VGAAVLFCRLREFPTSRNRSEKCGTPSRYLLCFFIPSLLFFFLTLGLSLRASAAETPQALVAAGRVDEAIRVLNEQIRTTPTAEAYNLLCRAHFELESWDTAIAECEKAVAVAPGDGVFHLWLGRVYGEKADRVIFLRAVGFAKKVRVEFERAVELAPTDWEARTDLAEFYLEAPGIVGGGEDKARAQADALEKWNPGMAHWVRARIAQKNKDAATAEKEYRAEIQASDGGARAWVNLAGFYRHMNRLDDMVQALRTMETRPLDRPAALMDGAGLLFRTGRENALAIRLVTRYLAAPTEEWPAFKAHNLLGDLLEKQGDRKGAVEQYRAALMLAHTYKRAQEGLQRMGI